MRRQELKQAPTHFESSDEEPPRHADKKKKKKKKKKKEATSSSEDRDARSESRSDARAFLLALQEKPARAQRTLLSNVDWALAEIPYSRCLELIEPLFAQLEQLAAPTMRLPDDERAQFAKSPEGRQLVELAAGLDALKQGCHLMRGLALRTPTLCLMTETGPKVVELNLDFKRLQSCEHLLFVACNDRHDFVLLAEATQNFKNILQATGNLERRETHYEELSLPTAAKIKKHIKEIQSRTPSLHKALGEPLAFALTKALGICKPLVK